MANPEFGIYCPGADEVLDNLASSKRGNVERDIGVVEEDYSPDRVVSWARGKTQYSVSMVVEEGELHLWATAWRDDEQRQVRRGLTPLERSYPTPVNKEVFQTSIDDMLKELRPKVGFLNLRGAQNVEGLIVTPLTPQRT